MEMDKKIQAKSNLNPSYLQASGFAMIEVLISVIILSVGLLGLAGLQVIGMKGTQHATMTTQATLLTQRLAEKIRANPNGNYDQITNCSASIPT
ncbi:MAG: type IV pilus modification protein PilV, partial [Bacteroidales bacterium]|nr:type IV pilus modification protein PilV [Bacteroidales bacterium]